MRWLRDLVVRGYLHGDLNEYREGWSGSFSNADSGRALQLLEEVGWIRRGHYEATVSQRAFLGLEMRLPTPHKLNPHFRECWYWQLAEEKRIEVRAFLAHPLPPQKPREVSP
jgi:hypothetical protein